MTEDKPKKKSFFGRFSNEAIYERRKARLLKKLDKEYTGATRRKEISDLEAKINEHKMENRKPRKKVKIGGFNFSI